MKSIMFTSELIKAILDNQKTMTRRVIKIPKKHIDWTGKSDWLESGGHIYHRTFAENFLRMPLDCIQVKPKYKIQEVIYVKETWGRVDYLDDVILEETKTIYKADYPEGFDWCDDDGMVSYNKGEQEKSGWKSPMFMPEKYSRIKLQITNIRVEKLKDMTSTEAQAEGIIYKNQGVNQWGQNLPGWGTKEATEKGSEYCMGSAYFAFANLWNSINKPPYDWTSNPFVFCYEFKVVKK